MTGRAEAGTGPPTKRSGPRQRTAVAERVATTATAEDIPHGRQEAAGALAARRLMLEPGLAEYCQGYADGRNAGRREAVEVLASRADCVDATWRPVERPSYEDRVAERVAVFEAAGSRWPARAAECVARDAEQDSRALRAAAKTPAINRSWKDLAAECPCALPHDLDQAAEVLADRAKAFQHALAVTREQGS